jgi:hypothetical protein
MRRPTRKTVIRVAIGVIVALAVILIPGYLSTRPSFYSRYPITQKAHSSWSKSTHAQVACESCHVRPTIPAQFVYRAKLFGEFYLSVVSRDRRPGTLEDPSNEACIRCHLDLRTVSPKGDLQIPHRAHISVLKMKCVECHDYLVHSKSPEGKHTPPMAGCLECHDGDTAKDACTACHTEKAAPDSHKANDWTVVHATKKDDPECLECHAWIDKWCVDCHQRRPKSHTKDWRATHRDQVTKRRNCEACHEAEFCIRCHGEVPQRDFDQTLKLVQ